MFSSKSPREVAEGKVQALFQDMHGIADPAKKEEMVQDFLWRNLAPLHDLHNPKDMDTAMENLWAAVLVKSIFGLGTVEKRLRDFTKQQNELLKSMQPEGIGLMTYLLTPNPDTFGRLIEEATAKLSHGRRKGHYPIMTMEEEYPILFSSSKVPAAG